MRKAAETKGDMPALKIERPLPALDSEGKPPPALPDEEWTTWTWKEYYDTARQAAKGTLGMHGRAEQDAANFQSFQTRPV